MAWTPPSDAVETQATSNTKGWTPPSDAVETQQAKPTATTKAPSLFESFMGGAASLADFPLSAPGFVAATGAELATTAGGMLASPFTKETPKEAYGRGARVGEAVGEALMNPAQKLMSMFGAADAYAQAPLPQAMSWFGELLQTGGKKLEAATGIPSEAVPLMTNVGMVAAGGVGAKKALASATADKAPTKPSIKEEPTIKPPPEGAPPEAWAAHEARIKAIDAEKASKSPLVETAIRNKETGEIERMGPKHDQARKEATKDTHEEGFVDERGVFHERQTAVDQAKRAGQIPEDYKLTQPEGEQIGRAHV